MEKPVSQSPQPKRRVWLWALSAIAVFALCLGLGQFLHAALAPASAFAAAKQPSAPTPAPAPTPLAGGAPTPAPTPTLSPEEALLQAADRAYMQDRANILLLGYDKSPEREDAESTLYRDEKNNYRSDVLMLASVDFATGRVALLSIPRDTMSRIYNTTGRYKINAAFAKGGSAQSDGFLYARKTVEALLGVPIHNHAGVDMQGVKAVVDAMGGVDYDVDVRIELNGRVLEEGYQHLNGQQVLDYCRARKHITGSNSRGANSDLGRADRQQRMIFAIFSQLQSRKQLVNIPRIYAGVREDITTDLTARQIAALASFGLGVDTATQLQRYTLEGKMIGDTPYSGASYYVLDMDALQETMREVFGTDWAWDVDYRMDYRYVLADKTMALGSAYADAAAYLCALLGVDLALYGQNQNGYAGYDSVYTPLKAACDELQALCGARKTGDMDEKITREAMLSREADAALIAAKTEALRAGLYSLCLSRGLTQAHVDEKRVPEEFYDLLPLPQPVVLPE